MTAALAWLLVGAVVGSFLNVCIHRIPRGESVVLPRSHCPVCNRTLGPRELIPLLSFLLQKGRCRGCGAPIPWRYPAVEGITAVAFFLLYRLFGAFTPELLLASGLFACLLAIAAIDIRHRIIPNRILVFVLPALLLILAAKTPARPEIWLEALGGALAFGGPMLLLALLSKEGMGMGDVKFGLVFGLLLNWHYAFLALTVASLSGLLTGLAGMAFLGWGRKTPVPFGPFLALGVFAAFLAQQGVIPIPWEILVGK